VGTENSLELATVTRSHAKVAIEYDGDALAPIVFQLWLVRIFAFSDKIDLCVRPVAKRFHVRFSTSAQRAYPRGYNRLSVAPDKLRIDHHERAVLAENNLAFFHDTLLPFMLFGCNSQPTILAVRLCGFATIVSPSSIYRFVFSFLCIFVLLYGRFLSPMLGCTAGKHTADFTNQGILKL
jgi:hypothetical protein